MACISVKEQGQLNRSVRGLTESTATRYFVVTFNAATTTVAAETASDGTNTIPVVGTALAGDPAGRYVSQVEGRGIEESLNLIFTVQVDYSNAIIQDPLNQPARISWDFDDATEKYFFDKDPSPPGGGGPGKPVLNSAAESFEDLLERETGSIRCTWKKYVAVGVYSPSTAVSYKDAVSTDSFTIDGVAVGAGQAKMKAYTAGEVQTTNVAGTQIQYREITRTLQFRSAWTDVVDDRGYNEKDTSNAGKVKEIIKGTPPVKTDKPWPLNGSGNAKPNITDAPSQLTFYPYNVLAFGGFGWT